MHPSLERRSNWRYSPSWMGSLLMHSRDPSGRYYRRNRFYDASSGRFTQEDPIGIAGGLNVYGYANGDPISYSDPYGLSADCKESRIKCIRSAINEARAAAARRERRAAERIARTMLGPGEHSEEAVAAQVAETDQVINMTMGFMGGTGGAQRGTTVLGHFPEYIARARELGARSIQARGNWTWEGNRRFLAGVVRRGDEVVLSVHKDAVRVGSVLEREIQYLMQRGYGFAEDGVRMLPGPRE